MNTVHEYRTLATEIAGTMERAASTVCAAEEAHTEGRRQIDEQLESARSVLSSHRELSMRAMEDVRRADDTAERVWCEVRAYVGRRAAGRLAELPEPRQGPAGTDAEGLLSEAKDLLARARRGEWSADPVRYRGVMAILIGAVVAAMVFGLARVVLGFSSEEDLLLNLLAQLAVFLSPFAGIPLIGWGMSRFRGQRADVGTVALTVLGGLIVSCVLTFLIH